jgi:glycosyltransferase involved in cell wall biosynthesis
MIHGIFEAELKNVATALKAVLLLRERGLPCRVVRVSILPLSAGEKAILKPNRYLRSVPPAKVARKLRSCDLLLFPSLPAEGFGLPLVEAMASRVPAVSSRIPSTQYIAGQAVDLVEPHDPAAFADAAQPLLSRPELWRRAQESGFRAVQKFLPREVGSLLEQGLLWATGSAVGKEPEQP